MSDSSARAGNPRARRWRWFWLALPLALLLAVTVSVVRNSKRLDREWLDALAEVDQHDPRWRWEDLEAERPAVPDDENAALIVLDLSRQGLLKTGEFWHPDRSAFDHFPHLPPTVRRAPDLARNLSRQLDEIKPAIDRAMALADRPQGRFPPLVLAPEIINTVLPGRDEIRSVADLLRAEAARRAEAGDSATALTAIRAGLNAARAGGNELMIIPMLVRTNVDYMMVMRLERVLAQVEATDADLAKVQRALEDEAGAARLLTAFRGQRAARMLLFDNALNGVVDPETVVPSNSPGDKLDDLLARTRIRRSRIEALRMGTNCVELAKRPSWEWIDGLRGIAPEDGHCAVFVGLMFPVDEKVFHAELKTRARLATAAVGVAAERFRLARGAWPRSTEDLVATGLLSRPLQDPYTGRPLQLKVMPFGLLVYSVGPDRVHEEVSTADSWNDDGHRRDVWFRLYDPKCRRATVESLPMPRVWYD